MSVLRRLLWTRLLKCSPDVRWWLKTDGCYVYPGLCESVRLKWSGDIDLNDGQLQEQYSRYQQRLQITSKIGVSLHTSISAIKDLAPVLDEDLTFLRAG